MIELLSHADFLLKKIQNTRDMPKIQKLFQCENDSKNKD